MDKRSLEDLEKAINFVKKHGYEAHMPEEMIKANKMLLSLKRLKRLRDEILNLKQSTVAEIRSYSKPPDQVHKVMIATYLLLGLKEKELQVCTMQDLFKTGLVFDRSFVDMNLKYRYFQDLVLLLSPRTRSKQS